VLHNTCIFPRREYNHITTYTRTPQTISYATITIIHHGTHTHLRALIKSSHPMYFQFNHHIKQHNMFAYQNVKATLLRHITETFYTHIHSNTNVHHIDKNIIIETTNRTHQTTHRINSYRNIKTSEFLLLFLSPRTSIHTNTFSYTYTHMHNIDQSLNRLIHKIPSEQPGRIEASHMGCPEGLAFRRTAKRGARL
jgi:hypothetical protein